MQCAGRAGLHETSWHPSASAGKHDAYDTAKCKPGARKLKLAVLTAMQRGLTVLLAVDGFAPTEARQLAAFVGALVMDAKRLGVAPPAALQCIVTCEEKLVGPAGPRTVVHIGRLTVGEQEAVCRKWLARFGKENVSPAHLEKVRGRTDSHLPLYLVLFSYEASLHAVFESVNSALEKYPEQLPELWTRKTLKRLEETTDVAVVRFFMRHLLASQHGMSLTQLKAAARGNADLRKLAPAAVSRMLDVIADNLRIFLTSLDEDVMSLDSSTLRRSSMHAYAPKALRRYMARAQLKKWVDATEGAWSRSRPTHARTHARTHKHTHTHARARTRGGLEDVPQLAARAEGSSVDKGASNLCHAMRGGVGLTRAGVQKGRKLGSLRFKV